MKDTKHIRQDFHWVAWVMPQGSDLGVPWGVEWSKKIPKFNQICCVSNLHQYATAQCFWSPPLGPWGGAKRSNFIKSQSQSQFQRFLNQTLCVFSQIIDIKHIRRDFHSVAWVMPQGWDLGVPWGVGGVQKLFFPNSTRFGVWVTYMNGTCNGTMFWVPASWGLGEGPKGQISLNLNYKVIFKDFKLNFVCLLTNERYKTY